MGERGQLRGGGHAEGMWVFGGGGPGSGRAARGAPRRGARAPGPVAPGKAKAAGPGARRAEAGRGAVERGPAGRGDARGARRACAGRGLGGRRGFPGPEEGRRVRSPVCLASLGQGASGAPLKFGSQKTEFLGRKSVLARSGSCWGRLAFLPLAVDPTRRRRRRRLENFFFFFFGDLQPPKRRGPWRSGRRAGVAGRTSGGGRGRWREEGCLRWGGGSGPNPDLQEGSKRGDGEELVVWSVWRGDTGVNSGGSPGEAGEKRAPPGLGCHRHGTLRSRVVCFYSYVLVTVIWLLLKMRAHSDCDH